MRPASERDLRDRVRLQRRDRLVHDVVRRAEGHRVAALGPVRDLRDVEVERLLPGCERLQERHRLPADLRLREPEPPGDPVRDRGLVALARRRVVDLPVLRLRAARPPRGRRRGCRSPARDCRPRRGSGPLSRIRESPWARPVYRLPSQRATRARVVRARPKRTVRIAAFPPRDGERGAASVPACALASVARMASPFVELEVGERVVKLTNPDKVLFPKAGKSKLDLARVLHRGRRRDRARAVRAPDAASALPRRSEGRGDLPEAGARETARMGRGRTCDVSLGTTRRRALRHRARASRLGGEPRGGRLPPVAVAAAGHGAS